MVPINTDASWQLGKIFRLRGGFAFYRENVISLPHVIMQIKLYYKGTTNLHAAVNFRIH